jgi:hypothetical protein
MIVDRFEISLDRLDRLNRGIDVRANGGVGLPLECSFNRTVRSDSVPAICAVDDRAVGQIVGKLKDGTPAIRALYLDAQGALSHGPVLPMTELQHMELVVSTG